MSQETGETRDAIIEEENRHLEKIIHANRDIKEPYWIVVFAKPSKIRVDGKPTLNRFIKAYSKKPASQVGMIIREVDNRKGTIEIEVNMPQIPFNFDALPRKGKAFDEVVVETTSIPNAYITK